MIFGEMNSCNKIDNVNILELIPQRSPFVMVNKLTYFDPIVTTSEFTVCSDNLFFCEGRLLATGMIENIAQTCAARIGYINRLSDETVKLGFIGAIRNLKINRTPKEGETIHTTITIIIAFQCFFQKFLKANKNRVPGFIFYSFNFI